MTTARLLWLRPHGALLLAVGLSLLACKPRKPLPIKTDGGPVVELIEPPPRPRAGSEPPVAAPLLDEREPNDSREQAQAIEGMPARATGAGSSTAPPPGSGVRGSLAPPTAQAAGKGDDDFYVLGPVTEPQLLRIELTTGPRAEVSLELLDEQGGRMALLDERGRGEGERLANLLLGPAQRFFLRVRGSVAGQQALADAEYRLLAVATPAPPGSEREPNDTPLLATSATEGGALQRSLTGALAWRRDEDVWVIGLAEALGHRPPAGTAPGLSTAAVLRIELDAPGLVPALKVQLEAAPAAGATPSDAGTTPPLTPALDLAAPSAGELRLRNVGIPAGTARAYVTVRAGSFQKPPGAERYHLRLAVEPALEAAEVEPNDDCARATAVTVTDGEDQLRGFLWPGDVDCYRLVPPSPAAQRWKVQLSVPADECKASLELARADGAIKTPAAPPHAAAAKETAGATKEAVGAAPLTVRARGDVFVRVVGQRRSTCFREPYRLTAQVEPDGGAP